jgi:trigger factor
MIEKLREQKKDWNTVQRAAQEHDRVTISFTGVSGGENFTDGKVENYQVEIGSGQMIPGFEDHLMGLEADTNKAFEISFPEEYGNDKLAGEIAEFEVRVIRVEKAVLPEVDTDFIKAYGVDDGDMDTFRKDLEGKMQRELDQALQSNLKNAVMDGLNAKIKVTLPKAMIDQEIEALNKQYAENAKKQNQDAQDLELPREIFEAQAKRRVALGLILSEIIQKNEIKVDGNRVRSTIEDMATSFDHPDEVVNWYYADTGRLNEIEQMVLEDQVVDWVLEKVTVTDESAHFDEIMNRN